MNKNLRGIERALIIKQPHIGRILDNLKVWEMRSTETKIRGWIALIEQGTGLIVGKAFLGDSWRVSSEVLRKSGDMHCLDYSTGNYDKWDYAWHLTGVQKFNEPVPYKHPMGAVIWVKSEAWNG